jgi:Uncharacterised nucleotidyltransferase
LHWRSSSSFPVEQMQDKAWWQSLRRCDLAGVSARQIVRSELFVMLCVHGAKHRWSQLSWLVDVASLADKLTPLEWDSVERQSRLLGVVQRMRLALGLAKQLQLLHTFPSSFSILEADGVRLRRLGDEIISRLQGNEPIKTSAYVYLIEEISLSDTRRDAFREVMRVVVSPNIAQWIEARAAGRRGVVAWLARLGKRTVGARWTLM